MKNWLLLQHNWPTLIRSKDVWKKPWRSINLYWDQGKAKEEKQVDMKELGYLICIILQHGEGYEHQGSCIQQYGGSASKEEESF